MTWFECAVVVALLAIGAIVGGSTARMGRRLAPTALRAAIVQLVG